MKLAIVEMRNSKGRGLMLLFGKHDKDVTLVPSLMLKRAMKSERPSPALRGRLSQRESVAYPSLTLRITSGQIGSLLVAVAADAIG